MLNFFKIENTKSRIFGLDLLRFFAIFFVLLGHSKIFMPDDSKWLVNRIMLDGVSIFFVLSGFLIGGILIKILEREKATFKNLLHFWKRRWMRTVPAYFTVLTILVVFTYIMKPQRLADTFYLYYVFMQNMWNPQPSFFSESWSLSIEEWFYLLIPAFLFIGIRLSKWKPKHWFLIVIFVVAISTILYRAYLYYHNFYPTQEAVNVKVMMQIFTRLDAIMFGVLGAYLAYYFPKIWNFKNFILLCIGVIALYALKYYNQGYNSGLNIIWMPTLKAIATLILIPFLSNLKTSIGVISRFVTTVSLISYSMYLLNLNIVINVLIKYVFHGNLLRYYVKTENWIWDYIAFWLLTFVLSFLLYKLVEVPFMKLRDKRIVS